MAEKTKLEIRQAIKKRKPTYRRRQSNQYAKIAKNDSWRRPKGMGNKSRRNRRGHIGMLKVGYGSPKEVRGANREGFFEVVIANIHQLEQVDSKTQIAIISRTVGDKKKLEILEYAQKQKVSIGNVKDISATITAIKAKREEKVEEKTKKVQKAVKSKEEKPKSESKDESKTQAKSDSKEKDSKEVAKQDTKPVVKKEEAQPAKKVTTTTTTTTKTTSKKVNASSSASKSSTTEVSKK